MDFPSWLGFALAVLPHIARAVIEGSRAAGVNHDTVALTVAKTINHVLNGVQPQATADTPVPPSPGTAL
jgi:hypothetical protein